MAPINSQSITAHVQTISFISFTFEQLDEAYNPGTVIFISEKVHEPRLKWTDKQFVLTRIKNE